MDQSLYHSMLRVAIVVCAIALVFDSGVVSDTTKQLSNGTQSYLANAVGMSASVEPTELNTLTAEFTARMRMLDEREAALRDREIAVDLNQGGGNDYSTYVLSGILFILLVLILLNYTLDYLRLKEQTRQQNFSTN